MTQVSARLPDELIRGIDEEAKRLKWSRSAIIRQAIERHLVLLQDPADPILDRDEVRDDLFAAD